MAKAKKSAKKTDQQTDLMRDMNDKSLEDTQRTLADSDQS